MFTASLFPYFSLWASLLFGVVVRKKVIVLTVLFLFVGVQSAFAFLPVAAVAVRAVLARFVPSTAVVAVAAGRGKQLAILSSRFAAKYPQAGGASVLVMRRSLTGVLAGTALAFLVDLGFPQGETMSCSPSDAQLAANRAAIENSPAAVNCGNGLMSCKWVRSPSSTSLNWAENYSGFNTSGVTIAQFGGVGQTCSITSGGGGTPVDPLDQMIIEFESLPDQAAMDSYATQKVNDLKAFSAANPGMSFDDSITLLESGDLNGVGYSVDANGKAHLYTSDSSGTLSVDGNVVDTQAPDYSDTMTYTDDSGVLHTVTIDENGGLVDNGMAVNFGPTVNTVQSSSTDAAGNTTTTTTVSNGSGSSSTTTTTTTPTGTTTTTASGTTTTPADLKGIADAKASGIADELGKKLSLFDGVAGSTLPKMQFHVAGVLAHETDMSGEFASLGASSMLIAIMGTFGMLISLLLVTRAILS